MEKKISLLILEELLKRYALGGGIKGYIITKVIEFTFNKFLSPAIIFIITKGEHIIDNKRIHISIKELEDAQTDIDFDNAVDDLM